MGLCRYKIKCFSPVYLSFVNLIQPAKEPQEEIRGKVSTSTVWLVSNRSSPVAATARDPRPLDMSRRPEVRAAAVPASRTAASRVPGGDW